MLSSSPNPRHRRLHRRPAQAPGPLHGSPPGSRHGAHARQTLRARVLAAGASHAARRELLDDVRKSAGRPRIETHDPGEQIRWRTRRTLASTWHRNQRRRQRPMASLLQQLCSKGGDRGAPAGRQSGRRSVDHSPPPRKLPCRSTSQPYGAAPDVVRRQCWPPIMPSTTATAAAWRQRQQQPLPGSSAVAQPARARRPTLGSSEPLDRKIACEVLSPPPVVSDRATDTHNRAL